MSLPHFHSTISHLFISERELYMLSPVRLSSVTLVRPILSRQRFYAIWYHGHPVTSRKILRRSSQGNPFVGELNAREVAKLSKYRHFEPIEGYISETVQDRK